MQRLLGYNQHPVFSVFPHVLVHVLRGHRYAASASQKLNLINTRSQNSTIAEVKTVRTEQ